MAVKKSELYSSLWASCDELRGGMDASQYKNYVLVLLFIKYVSDKYAGKDYATITVPPGASFADMVALKGKKDIGDLINKQVIAPMEQANELSFGGIDFNDTSLLGTDKEMVERLTNLIAIFENPALDFSKNRADGDDLLGDAYEYLMRHFATESGKSKGQFYTPAEVSRIIARILGIREAETTNATTVYDPTCGSGSLLLKVGDEAAHGKNPGVTVTLHGQEKDVATTVLARMNMILHDYGTAEIKGDGQSTLARPWTENGVLKTFDYVVANPPFSDKRWSTGFDPAADEFGRFEGYGIPPAKQGDFAYLIHILRSLKSTGKGACILPHGVLFRGNAEAVIRRNLVQRGVIKGIIGLPANLFYGTGIPACIVVLDKEGAAQRKAIFMMDASKGFMKDGPKNRLREQDLHKIVDTFTRQDESDPRYARLVPVSEIADPKNDYNLNLPRYIDSTEPEDIQDIDAHLRGGIPDRDLDALEHYWKIMPGVRSVLFSPLPLGEGPGVRARSVLRVPTSEIKASIFAHPEFTAFTAKAKKLFTQWQTANVPRLKGLAPGSHPKALVEALGESLLAAFSSDGADRSDRSVGSVGSGGATGLVDAYDVYQHLMDYWAETMQDDCYMIAADGWVARTYRILETDKKGRTRDKGWACDLLPKALIVARYFAKEQAAIEARQAALEATTAALAELEEEHGGEEGYLGSLDKVAKLEITAQLKALKSDRSDRSDGSQEEAAVLQQWLKLNTEEAEHKKALREVEAALDLLAYEKYPQLSVAEIQTLVVDDKWLTTLAAAVQGELDRVSQTLTGRIRQLAERYATPLPQLTDEVAALAAKVDQHLQKMGAVWK
jgi:type I restriction enzyme M protein